MERAFAGVENTDRAPSIELVQVSGHLDARFPSVDLLVYIQMRYRVNPAALGVGPFRHAGYLLDRGVGTGESEAISCRHVM